MDHHGMGPRELEALIYRDSGLLGVSGLSQHMRTFWAKAAPEAIGHFAYQILREIGALGGLVVTTGIGEKDAALRETVCEGCRWPGLVPDAARNAGGRCISAAGSAVAARVIPTDEERMIARHTLRVAVLGQRDRGYW